MAIPFDWNDLRFFLAVARIGRLTTAARRLGVDHATVARRIESLEQALGADLFARSPRGYALTPAGERLMKHAEEMESTAQTLHNELAGARMALGGTVRIGAPDGFGTYFLAPRLGSLAERYPGLDLQLVAMPRLFSLSKREADIAVGLAQPTEGRLAARKLTDYRLALYASRDYLDRHPPIRITDDLRSHPFVGYIPDLIFAEELDYLPQIGSGLNLHVTSSSIIAQMRATVASAGLAILPCFMAAEEPRLVRVLPHVISINRTFWLIVHADLREVARVRAVIEFITGAVEQQRALFLPPF
jgi:DNA-binding transcriptional LysR family regulator